MEARLAAALALGSTELLLARASGNVQAPLDVLAAVVFAALLALPPVRMLPFVVFAGGLLLPVLLPGGIFVAVWSSLVLAVGIATRRRVFGPRAQIFALAGVFAFAWFLVGVAEGKPPPSAAIVGVGGALAACIALGRWAPLLVPLVFVPDGAPSERWTAAGPVPEGPDIVLVTVDTLRVDAAREMPRLVAAGTFGEAQAPSPWTLPSLATLHTGVLPSRHGAVRLAHGFGTLDPALDTLAEQLAAKGYDTAATVESPFADPRFGLGAGFARYRAYATRPWVLPRAPRTERARPLAANLAGFDREAWGANRRVADVRDFLAVRRERPLFIWVHFIDTHLPYAHTDDLSLAAATRRSIGEHPSKETLTMLHVAYRAEAAVVDAAIGEIVAAVSPGATLIVTADHGEEFGEHGGWEHGHAMWQELLSVPMVTRGIAPPVGLVDVAPLLLGEDRPPAGVYSSVNPLYGPLDLRAVRVGDRKRIAVGETRTSFDLATDPRELHPVDDAGLEPLLPSVSGGEGLGVEIDDAVRDALRALGYEDG